MKSYQKILFLTLIAVSLLASSCSSSFTRMETVVEYRNLALYRLSERSYPSDEQIVRELPPVEHFPELEESVYRGLFGNLEFEKRDFWFSSRRRVFYEEEMDYMIPILIRSVRNLSPGERLVVISRFDPDKSVLSRMERVSFVLWWDANGVNLVFGDLREEIPHNDPLSPDDWNRILPISFSEARAGQNVLPPEGGHLKTVLNQEHQSWVVFPVEKLENLVYQPFVDPDEKSEKIDEPEEPASQDRSHHLLGELRELNQAKAEGLISDEEFEKMRQKIIDSYGSSRNK